MGRATPLDRFIGDESPSLATLHALAKFESIPYDERILAKSTYEALCIGAAIDPEASAIVFLPNADPDDTPITLSYRQFMDRLRQVANMFTDLGIGKDDVVSFLMPLLPEAFISLFAAEAVGIANPVNPLLEPVQLAGILRAANTKVLVALGPMQGSQIWEKVLLIKEEIPSLQRILVVHGAADERANIYDFNGMADLQPADSLKSDREISAHDIAAYFHTGGTTGTPKLVPHTHRNQIYQAWLMHLLYPGQVGLFGLPLFHVAGALTGALTAFAGGITCVVPSASGWRNPKALANCWRLVERFRPEIFAAVPTVLAAALQVPIGDSDLSSLRCCIGGGSAIPVAVGQGYLDLLKVPIYEVLGMTEMASVNLASYPGRELRLGSVGHATPYSAVRVVVLGAEGEYIRDCAANEIGILAFNGPGAFSGYLSQLHNQSAFIEQGWVNSGDLGRIDEEGYVWVTGRAKDVIIRGGHNIDPIVIEDILFQHPAVALAAVVGEPDAYAGELPVAFVQLKAGNEVEIDALLEFVRQRSPERAANPVRLYRVDAIPMTGVGKVFKPALRLDAAKRRVTQLLVELKTPGVQMHVEATAHEVHGSLLIVNVRGASDEIREGVGVEIAKRLDSMPLRHEVRWHE